MSTVTSSVTSSRIPLLTSANYDTWKTRMEMLLIRERLWPIVCQRRTRPEGFGLGEDVSRAQHEFDDEAERATATIFQYLDDSSERMVRDLRDPAELWKKLRDMYSSTGFCTRFGLWRKLLKAHLRDYGSIHEYIESIESSRRQLKDAGFEVDDEIMAAVLLKGLPGSYSDFVASVTEAYELSEAIRYDGLLVLLLAESRRQGDERRSDAVIAMGSKKPASAVNGKEPVLRCGSCGKKGHKTKDCRTRQREENYHSNGGTLNVDPTQDVVIW